MCSHRAASLQLTGSREPLTFCSALACSFGAFTSQDAERLSHLISGYLNRCVKFERPALGSAVLHCNTAPVVACAGVDVSWTPPSVPNTLSKLHRSISSRASGLVQIA